MHKEHGKHDLDSSERFQPAGVQINNRVFEGYWRHKEFKERAARLPRPVLACFQTEGLDEIERLYWSKCQLCPRILDIGAGDNRLKRKFPAQGYQGCYDTFDISNEFEHDYYSLDGVRGPYDAILLLEVIEHMNLSDFYALMERVEGLLTPEGLLIISTPNPACIYPMWAGDMTHVQQYPLNDLLAFFLMRGYECEAYRVVYQGKERLSLVERFRGFLKKAITTQVLGVDYADGLIVVARRQGRDADRL